MLKVVNELGKEEKKNNSGRWDAKNSGLEVGGRCGSRVWVIKHLADIKSS